MAEPVLVEVPSTPTPNDADLGRHVAAVGAQYPALEPHLKDTVVTYGTSAGPNDDRQLEFYHPWDTANPNPGKNTIEIFDKSLSSRDLQAAIAGDMLHRLGSVDPTTGKPVDPTFHALKQQLGAARDPNHQRADREVYESQKSSPFPPGEYGTWDQHSRLDAYVRGGLFPQQNPGWDEFITPGMQPTIESMRNHLTRRPVPPPRQPETRLGDIE